MEEEHAEVEIGELISARVIVNQLIGEKFRRVSIVDFIRDLEWRPFMIRTASLPLLGKSKSFDVVSYLPSDADFVKRL